MDPQQTKTCPMCGESILAVAIKCKHCRSMLGTYPNPLPPSRPQEVRIGEHPDESTAVRSFGRTFSFCLVASLPGFVVFGMLAAGAIVRLVRGLHIGDDMGFAVGRTVLMALLCWGALGLPAALAFAGALRFVRKGGEAGIAAIVCLIATLAFYGVFSYAMDELVGGYGYVASDGYLWFAAALSSVGGALAGWSKGCLPTLLEREN